jgi:hemerythrin-like domain-containing protein
MKRSNALKTLSFEHHDGLRIALHIKNELRRADHFTDLIEYIHQIYSPNLLHHFKQEETALLAPLQDDPQASALVNRIRSEHAQLSVLHKLIQQNTKEAKQHIREFGKLLHDHIRFEERKFFPLAEQKLSTTQLNQIEDYLKREHKPLFDNCKI